MAASEERFLQVVQAYVGGAEPLGKLLSLQERAAFVDVGDGSLAVIIWPSLRGEALRDAIQEMLDRDRVTHLKLLIVGGDAEMRDVLSGVKQGFLSRRMIQTFHLRDDADIWAGQASWLTGQFGGVLERVAGAKASGEAPTRDSLRSVTVPPPSPEDRERAVEHMAFIDRFRARKPRLTLGLIAFIGVVFALEMWWGGAEFVPTLVRMGANTSASLDEEPWRLLASASLHAGVLHVMINAYVLYALGGFLERIIGWARFGVLYVTAALLGSLASGLFSGADLSVGASGAIWGVLGAAGALALRPGKLLPRNLVSPMRRTAAINLVINLAVSTMPQVDIMAHLGGGLAGGLLVLTGVLTRGLDAVDPENAKQHHPEPRSWVIGAVAGLGLLAASLIPAWLTDEPWRLTQPPSYQSHQLGQTGLRIEVPELLGDAERVAEAGQVDFVFGALRSDPIMVVVSLLSRGAGAISEAEIESARVAFLAADADVVPGTQRQGERRIVADAAYPTYEELYAAPDGRLFRFRHALFPQGHVTSAVVYFADTPAAYREAVDHIVDSVAPG